MLSKEFITEEPSDPDRGQTGPAPIPDWLKNAKSYLSDKLGFTKPGDRPAGTQSQADANRARVKGALPDNMSMNDFNKARDASEPEELPTPISPTADAKSDILPPATPAVQVGAPIPATKLQATELPGVQVGTPIPTTKLQATPLPAQKSFAEPAATGAAPTPMKGGYGSGVDNPSVAPKATDPAAQYAAADAGRAAVKSSETNPELERMKTNAGISSTADAKSDIKGAPSFAGQTDEFGGMESPPTAAAPRTEKAINPETGQEYDKLATAQSANDGDAGDDLAKIKANAGLAQSANDGDAGEAQAAAAAPAPAVAAAPAQAAEPAPAPVKAFVEPEPAPAAPASPAAPAAVGQSAASMAGAMRSTGQAAPKPAAKSDPAVLKQQQDLIAKGAKIKADGVMGPATQAAIKQFAAAPAASRSTAPSAGGGRGFVNPTAPAAPAKPAVKESQEINRMRFLAGLTKD